LKPYSNCGGAVQHIWGGNNERKKGKRPPKVVGFDPKKGGTKTLMPRGSGFARKTKEWRKEKINFDGPCMWVRGGSITQPERAGRGRADRAESLKKCSSPYEEEASKGGGVHHFPPGGRWMIEGDVTVRMDGKNSNSP